MNDHVPWELTVLGVNSAKFPLCDPDLGKDYPVRTGFGAKSLYHELYASTGGGMRVKVRLGPLMFIGSCGAAYRWVRSFYT